MSVEVAKAKKDTCAAFSVIHRCRLHVLHLYIYVRVSMCRYQSTGPMRGEKAE